ncbi:coatomer subunit beta, putative [Babesia caballi]|uniref:Coatomer subunit beta' n=1 Tax=Babesia caballi TaxID=5871 RepID=A0AAV4M1Q4_BABCB|nr:coatomer subunit beta, putative [Babesia caballi]
MALQTGFVKKLELRKEKVKCVDLHPSEPWVVSGQYNGTCTIYNYLKQSLVKRIDVCNSPIRCCKFIARKQWLVAATDEKHILAYNYNSLEKVAAVAGHEDFVRYLEAHPTLPWVLSCSDDMTVVLWDIDRNWQRLCVFSGHQHYVMMAKWSPKDVYAFASCSLDHSIKFWSVAQDVADGRASGDTSPRPSFTLKGHTRGVNCIEYSTVAANPYIISGGDDKTIRVWDYQTKLCLQVLQQHALPVTCLVHHPRLPLLVSGGEDGELHLWHSTLYQVKRSVNFSMGKIWSVTSDATNLALGSDQGTLVVEFGGERPLVSLHGSKLVMVSTFDILSCNLSSADAAPADEAVGRPLDLDFRSIGRCEFFPQSVSHHPNGRFICLCGESEYVIYTAQGMRSKALGKAAQLVWSFEGHYATLEDAKVKVHHDFVCTATVQPAGTVVGIHGGRLLGVTTTTAIQFYDWTNTYLVRTIEANVLDVWWNASGTKVALGCMGNCYILKYDGEALSAALEAEDYDPSNGVSSAFEIEGEIVDRVNSATWAVDTFIYITAGLHLNLWTAGASEVLHYLDRTLYVVGYSSQNGCLYLCHNDVYAYPLPPEYLSFHSSVASRVDALARGQEHDDVAHLEQIIDGFSPRLRERASKFLESAGEYQLALRATAEPERHFEIHLKLGNVAECMRILRGMEESRQERPRDDAMRSKWKRLSSSCMDACDYDSAAECLVRCGDYSSAMLLYVVKGNQEGIARIAELATANGDANVAFTCHYMLNNVAECIQLLHRSGRHSEATIMAMHYRPSAMPESFERWREAFGVRTMALGEPELDVEGIALEEALRKRLSLGFPPASEYPKLKDAIHVDLRREENPVDLEELATSWYAGL